MVATLHPVIQISQQTSRALSAGVLPGRSYSDTNRDKNNIGRAAEKSPNLNRFRSGRRPAGLQVFRINTSRLVKPGSPWSYPLKKAELPLCSFGPGGDYIVDWYPQNYRPTIFEDQPQQDRPVMGRFALLMSELRDWLLGIHPGRQLRSEVHPEYLEACGVCGQHDSWSPWTRGERRAAMADVRAKLPAESPTELPVTSVVADITMAIPYPVSPASPATSPMAGESSAMAVMNLRTQPVDESSVSESIPFPHHLHLETQHDPHPKTVGGINRHPKLSPEAGLFSDYAGTGRRAGRVQGNGIRARSGSVRKKAGAAVRTQGTLFDALTRGEAA